MIIERPETLVDWQNCPVCSGALQTVVDEPGAQPHLECLGECKRPWYANPKPTANILLEHPDNGKLLLVKRGREPYKDCWDIPGGFVEEGEEGEAAALRELFEETGLHAKNLRFLGALSDRYGTDRAAFTFNLFWVATCTNPVDAKAASDVSDIAWLDRSELPSADALAFDCVPRAIALWLAHS